jgi:hypothetical protein
MPRVAGQSPLRVHDDPALKMSDISHVDTVLLSHENHTDDLDELGHQLLDGRLVGTTSDGAKNFAPRPNFSDSKTERREKYASPERPFASLLRLASIRQATNAFGLS